MKKVTIPLVLFMIGICLVIYMQIIKSGKGLDNLLVKNNEEATECMRMAVYAASAPGISYIYIVESDGVLKVYENGSIIDNRFVEDDSTESTSTYLIEKMPLSEETLDDLIMLADEVASNGNYLDKQMAFGGRIYQLYYKEQLYYAPMDIENIINDMFDKLMDYYRPPEEFWGWF